MEFGSEGVAGLRDRQCTLKLGGRTDRDTHATGASAGLGASGRTTDGGPTMVRLSDLATAVYGLGAR